MQKTAAQDKTQQPGELEQCPGSDTCFVLLEQSAPCPGRAPVERVEKILRRPGLVPPKTLRDLSSVIFVPSCAFSALKTQKQLQSTEREGVVSRGR